MPTYTWVCAAVLPPVQVHVAPPLMAAERPFPVSVPLMVQLPPPRRAEGGEPGVVMISAEARAATPRTATSATAVTRRIGLGHRVRDCATRAAAVCSAE